MTTTQKKFDNKQDAVKEAISMSLNGKTKYAAIILSNEEYFIEDQCPLVRSWESLIGEFENGKPID